MMGHRKFARSFSTIPVWGPGFLEHRFGASFIVGQKIILEVIHIPNRPLVVVEIGRGLRRCAPSQSCARAQMHYIVHQKTKQKLLYVPRVRTPTQVKNRPLRFPRSGAAGIM